MKQIVYVDSRYGNDSFAGDLDSPVQTLAQGIALAYEGGTVVLQTGTGTHLPATLTKNLTIKAAYGATPLVDTITYTNAQGLLEGLFFNSNTLSKGIVVNNQSIGSVIVRECQFRDVDTAIEINNAQYISIHRNYFKNHKSGVKINSAQEVCLSSNVFDGYPIQNRSVEVVSSVRVDMWGNTIYGASGVASGASPDQNLRIVYVTLTSFDIQYKRVALPGFACAALNGQYDVAVNSINGSSFLYGTDYTVNALGSIVSWDGMALQQTLAAGDVLRVMYSENQDPGSGDAVRLSNIGDPNSRVDSNSITGNTYADTAIGVFFTTPVKIRHNNFYRATKGWDGGVPSGDTGLQCITSDPLYRDPAASDFRLSYQGVSGTSPNIDAADPGRWGNVYAEMGVVNVGGKYTGSVTGIRSNVAPFDRSLDYDSYNRSVTGMVGTTGDIGAYEFNQHETAMGNYVAERGYDIAHAGTATGPYATLDRGYARAGSLDLYVDTHLVDCQVGVTGGYTGISHGTGYGRYHSKNIVLSDSEIKVGRSTGDDIAYVYSSYPAYETGAVYVGPDSGTGVTGTSDNPYRTIGDALGAGGSAVLVRPGFYPSFRGVSGVSLAGLAETRSDSIGHEFYSTMSAGWTGTGAYTTTQRAITFTGETGAVLSLFTLGETGPVVDIDLRYTVATQGFVCGGISNRIGITDSYDSVYATVDRLGQRTILGYSLDGVVYESAASYTGAFYNIKTRVRVVGGQYRVSVVGDDLDRSYGGDFGVTGLWRASFRSQGTGMVSDLYLYTDVFRGATGSVSSFGTRRKVFGILGSTGMQP
jgi:hypothetical protein